ncbi:MAG: ArsR family transcriptional regulator, partial [Actinomycetes bacterium]
MYRIHLTAQDMSRVRLLPTLGPMSEALSSLKVLRHERTSLVFGGWRRHVYDAMGYELRGLSSLMPAAGPALDLLSVAGPGRGMAESVDAVLSADRATVRMELDYYASRHPRVPDDLRDIVTDVGARANLLDRLTNYHQVAVEPMWSTITAHLDADIAARARTILSGGVEALLTTLHPRVRWEAPTLQLLDCSDGDFHLDGRGLILAPSFFRRQPATTYDIAGNCVLSYPAGIEVDGSGAFWGIGSPDRSLANLLGRTRALLLTAIGDGITGTGELALRAGTSAAAVSQHTKVLREAG